MIHTNKLHLFELLRHTSVFANYFYFLFTELRKWVHSVYAQMRKLEIRMVNEGGQSHTANEEWR